MSEYRYYEFRAVDRPLTQRRMKELRRLSSRATITPTSFVNVYNYGDFGGDPPALVRRDFDAFLHVANWGTRWLMLRVPARLLPAGTARSFGAGARLDVSEAGADVIVSLCSNDERGGGWEEGEGWLPALLPVRGALMRGDLRALHLGWLLGVQAREVGDDTLEPPVPPGLGALDEPHGKLAEFLRIDEDLITAAAERSARMPAASRSREQIRAWVDALPRGERDALLAALVDGDDPHLPLELRQRALRGGRTETLSRGAHRRTVAELRERAAVARRGRMEREARERARRAREEAERRARHIASLRGRAPELWDEIDVLLTQTTGRQQAYARVVVLLGELRDLSELERTRPAFGRKLSALVRAHSGKRALLERLEHAGFETARK